MKIKSFLQASPDFTIIFFALLSQAVFLANDGTYWDGMLMEHLLETERDYGLEWLSQTGLFIPKAFHWTISFFSDTRVAFKISNVALLCLMAWGVLGISERGLQQTKALSWMVAALSVAYPVYHLFASSSLNGYMLGMGAFFAGWRLYFEAVGGMRFAAWRKLAAFVLMFVGFSFNATLPLHYGLVFLTFVLLWPQYGQKAQTSKLIRLLGICRQEVVLWLLPLVFFALRQTIYKPYGTIYENYNNPFEHVSGFGSVVDALSGQLSLVSGHVWMAVAVIPSFVMWNAPWFASIGAAIALCTSFFCLADKSAKAPSTSNLSMKGSGKVLLWASFFLILAVLPFAVLGKLSPRIWDWRFDFLVGFPVALLAVGAIGAGAQLIRKVHAERITLHGLAVLLGLFVAGNCYISLEWVARWAKDSAVVEALKQTTPSPDVTLFSVRDNFSQVVPGAYGFWEYTVYFTKAWGNEPRRTGFKESDFDYIFAHISSVPGAVGINRTYLNYMRPPNADIYALHGFEISRCYAEIRVERGALDISDIELAWHYLYGTWFDADALKDLRAKIVRVQVSDPIDLLFPPASCAAGGALDLSQGRLQRDRLIVIFN